ncbi:hypothetical protein [Thalassotalea sp. PLHSN55]|uniref:hypothetical protein n=1 Tax=Thalassotalea sp. PLHSN55 TaxID=3435888 RepID=UPI003F85EB8F
MEDKILFILRHLITAFAIVISVFYSQSHAAIITDRMEFTTLNQNMWKQGRHASWRTEHELVTRWGTYQGGEAESINFGSISGSKDTCIGGRIMGHCVGLDNVDTRTGAEVGVATSGQVGLKLNAQASGGSIDVFLPVATTIDIGDVSAANQMFSIGTGVNIENSAAITANAPSFSASLNGILDLDVSMSAVACATFVGCGGSTSNIGVHAGEFNLFGIDLNRDKPFDVFGHELPIKVFDKPKNIHMPTKSNPDGVDDEATPQNPADPSPIIGDVTFHTLTDQSGGEITGNGLSLQTNQNLLDAGISLTGLLEAWYGSPGLLHNEIKEKVGPTEAKIEYNILDLQVGPTLGMQQEFNIDPNATVRLEFDQPITRMVTQIVEKTAAECGFLLQNCPDIAYFTNTCNFFGICERTYHVRELVEETYDDGIFDMALGESADFFFNDQVGQLINRTYFLDDPLFHNNTAATIDPFIELKMGCMKITVIFTAFNECMVEESAQTNGLVSASLYNRSWQMAGFQEYSFASNIIDNPPVGVAEPKSVYLMLLAVLVFIVRATRYQI